MTAAAGFPIASVTAGTLAASPASKLAHTEATSFRAGFEALVTSVSTNPERNTSIETNTSDAAQSEIVEASNSAAEAALSDQKPALSPENTNQNKPGITTALASALKAPAQSQLQHTQKHAAATALQAPQMLQPEPIVFSAMNAARAEGPVASGKQSSSERTAQQKQSSTSNGDSKAASQTTLSLSGPLIPVPVLVSAPAQDAGHAISLRVASNSPVSDHSESTAGLTTETAPQNTSSVFTLPASMIYATTEPEGKTSSIAAAANAEPANPMEAHTTRALSTNAESAAQIALQHSASSLSSPDADFALKASSVQLNPNSVDNALQPAIVGPLSVVDALQAHAALNHASASRERGPIERNLSSAGTQQAIAIASQAIPARDFSGITGVSQERAGGTGQSTQSQAASPAVRDTFTALDADPGQPPATWVHTSSRQVEAGYQDPSLGWVSVRADLTPGGLHASVVPNSPEAAEALGSHLSGLNAYLAEHHEGIITASLAAPDNHSSTQDQSLTQNPGHHGQSGAEQQKESSESAAASTVPSQTISTSGTQTSEPVVFAPAHAGLISVIA